MTLFILFQGCLLYVLVRPIETPEKPVVKLETKSRKIETTSLKYEAKSNA
ncbi:hypothetical protein EV207_1242 [Scopulibacillus darangshiensis]|uniref:Uncharacterized protein n=1 Tax=Scopulibacillus darangshiensis TaxID=442528 RepID=A0A4R2NSX7_9BACL|nr:hypothetical protein EV207_1242 [Scopulibacillus darangshiensis]